MYVPSQAMTRNSSSSVISCTVTSGNAVTICCSGGRSALFLNSKSPMARERARLPLTRPKSTKPPAAVILAFSPGRGVSGDRCAHGKRLQAAVPSFCGLWSKDSGFALPLMPRTLLESPELACLHQPTPVMGHCRTYHEDLVASNDANGSGAAGDFLLVLGICQWPSASRLRRGRPHRGNIHR